MSNAINLHTLVGQKINKKKKTNNVQQPAFTIRKQTNIVIDLTTNTGTSASAANSANKLDNISANKSGGVTAVKLKGPDPVEPGKQKPGNNPNFKGQQMTQQSSNQKTNIIDLTADSTETAASKCGSKNIPARKSGGPVKPTPSGKPGGYTRPVNQKAGNKVLQKQNIKRNKTQLGNPSQEFNKSYLNQKWKELQELIKKAKEQKKAKEWAQQIVAAQKTEAENKKATELAHKLEKEKGEKELAQQLEKEKREKEPAPKMDTEAKKVELAMQIEQIREAVFEQKLGKEKEEQVLAEQLKKEKEEQVLAEQLEKENKKKLALQKESDEEQKQIQIEIESRRKANELAMQIQQIQPAPLWEVNFVKEPLFTPASLVSLGKPAPKQKTVVKVPPLNKKTIIKDQQMPAKETPEAQKVTPVPTQKVTPTQKQNVTPKNVTQKVIPKHTRPFATQKAELKSTGPSTSGQPLRQEYPVYPYGYHGYRKGIPRSFLRTHSQMDVTYSHVMAPAGIPRSFLMAQNQTDVIYPQASAPAGSQGLVWQLNRLSPDPIPQPLKVDTPVDIQPDPATEIPQQYSPTEACGDKYLDILEELESADNGAQKRLSAFQRLGPLSQPKKPKMTINLLCNKTNKDVREVVDKTEKEDKFTPVHLRQDILKSTDETVVKYLPSWPWRKNVPIRKSVTNRASKSVMLMEHEQMDEVYGKDSTFILVSVKGYPPTWKKEYVIDAVLEAVKGKTFIPCFIEFTPEECKFFVLRSRAALNTIYKLGFYIRKGDVELAIIISQITIGLKQIDFIPRLVLRKRLAQGYDGEMKLSLQAFTTKADISHFVYFPLNRQTNQTELVQLQSTIAWDFLTELNLSHNRITSVEGFNLPSTTPKLRHLDLSYNHLEKVTVLLRCRSLSLRSLKLEGNPLCHDYIDPSHYIKVVKIMFPELAEIDGLPIQLKGDMPQFKRNYCSEEAQDVVNSFLEIYFPMLEAPTEDRIAIADMYDQKAVLTITYRYLLRNKPLYGYFRNLFLHARSFDEGDIEAVEGAAEISKLICKWPELEHDPYSFTVDVMHHDETSTLLRISGVMKVTTVSLAEDEHILAFTRTFLLTTKNGVEYKIQNEMLYWDEPTKDCVASSFQINMVKAKRLSLKLESTPDAELKEKLMHIFMEITEADMDTSERCLETKEWNLKAALEHFMSLVKLDNLTLLRKSES